MLALDTWLVTCRSSYFTVQLFLVPFTFEEYRAKGEVSQQTFDFLYYATSPTVCKCLKSISLVCLKYLSLSLLCIRVFFLKQARWQVTMCHPPFLCQLLTQQVLHTHAMLGEVRERGSQVCELLFTFNSTWRYLMQILTPDLHLFIYAQFANLRYVFALYEQNMICFNFFKTFGRNQRSPVKWRSELQRAHAW